MQKLFMAVTATAFVAVGTATFPAQAALLDFSFTTESGATGTYTLNTDTAPASDQTLFGPAFTGILYKGAVSNFSFSSPLI